MCNIFNKLEDEVKDVFSKAEDDARGALRGIDDFTVGTLTGDFSRADDGRREFQSSFEDTVKTVFRETDQAVQTVLPVSPSNWKELGRTIDDDIRDNIVNPITDKLTNASGQAANAEKIANATIAAGEAQTAAQLAAMNAAARAAADSARLAAERDKAAKANKAQELAAPDVAIDDPNSNSSTAGAIRRRRAVFGRNYATGVKV